MDNKEKQLDDLKKSYERQLLHLNRVHNKSIKELKDWYENRKQSIT